MTINPALFFISNHNLACRLPQYTSIFLESSRLFISFSSIIVLSSAVMRSKAATPSLWRVVRPAPYWLRWGYAQKHPALSRHHQFRWFGFLVSGVGKGMDVARAVGLMYWPPIPPKPFFGRITTDSSSIKTRFPIEFTIDKLERIFVKNRSSLIKMRYQNKGGSLMPSGFWNKPLLTNLFRRFKVISNHGLPGTLGQEIELSNPLILAWTFLRMV